MTLNSDKTVNITNHPNTKLTTKTNVIVIQKGSNKGIMLSHAGKVSYLIDKIFNIFYNNYIIKLTIYYFLGSIRESNNGRKEIICY